MACQQGVGALWHTGRSCTQQVGTRANGKLHVAMDERAWRCLDIDCDIEGLRMCRATCKRPTRVHDPMCEVFEQCGTNACVAQPLPTETGAHVEGLPTFHHLPQECTRDIA